MALLIAHRGASGEAPENTLAAIQLAIQLGADCVEFDVRLTQDGFPVVIHDASLHRTTSTHAKKFVDALTLEEIRKYDAGIWFNQKFEGEKIPTLEEVLALDFKQTSLMIEIKKDRNPPSKVVKAVLETINRSQFKAPLAIGSFAPEIVKEVQSLNVPEITPTGIVEKANMLEVFKELNLKRIAIWYKLLNPSLIQQFHENDCQVWAFTVDKPEVVRFLLSIHVDGIITNHPRSMQTLK